MARRLVLTCALACALLPTAAARAVDNPNVPGSDWTQAQIESGDGTVLHADILRPKGLAATDKTPVIVSIGPYFNHSGEVGPLGPVEGADYDPTGPVDHPSSRFDDFVNGAGLMAKGYTFVMVDLRGFGGSGGCLDWGGDGEQMDVKAAVEWAAKQPFSTGAVGMYGKSYDGVTGLVGEVLEPTGLKAVVSMEPVYDLYRYLYSNGVRYENSLATPNLYNAIAAHPGPLLDDDISYNVNAFNTPDCLITNFATQQDANHTSDFWKKRTFIEAAKGKKTPLFLTQGFLENNTKPDGSFDFFNNLSGTQNRAWFGMWDHVRGNEVDGDGRLVEGRAGFFDEVMRFFDRHLKNDASAHPEADPKVVVQTSDGTWRGEQSWPPADSTPLTTTLKPGSFSGDGSNNGTGSGAGNGIWTISPPLAHDAWYSGVPKADLHLTPDALSINPQVVVDTYDISADREAILLSREAALIPTDGHVTADLYGNDWKIPAGHRLGVLVTDVNAEWWLPTQGTSFTLDSGTVTLPFLKYGRPNKIQGDPAVRLEEWLQDAPFTISEAVVTAGESSAFKLPPALTAAPTTPAPTTTPTATTTATPTDPGTSNPTPTSTTGPSTTPDPIITPGPTTTTDSARLRARIFRARRKGGGIVVKGIAPAGARLRVRLTVGGKTVATRAAVGGGRFRFTFAATKAGRYRAVVVARTGDATLRTRTRRLRS